MASTKHTIPANADLNGSGPGVLEFFSWLRANGVEPQQINAAQDVVVTANKTTKGITWSLTAATVNGTTGTWPLTQLPTLDVVNWLKQFAPKPVDVSEIKPILDKLKAARLRMNAAKEEAEELRAEVMAYLTARGATTGLIDGMPFVEDKVIPTKGKFDRAGFEKEYPEIAERFTGNDYDQHRLEFI